MAALCAATAIISIVVPFAGALALLGTVPMGLLAYRYRVRALIAATVAAGLIAFLIAGLGGLMTVGNSAYVGGLTGVVKRRRPRYRDGARRLRSSPERCSTSSWSRALAVLSRLRHLIFDAITANINGIAAVLTAIGRFATDASIPAQHTHRGRTRCDGPRTPVVPRRGAALLAVADLRQRHRLDRWSCR